MFDTPRGKAALFMILAALFLSIVPVFVKLIPADSGIPTTQKLFMRGVIATIVLAIVLRARGISFRPGSPVLLGARSLFGIAGMLTYFIAVEGMPLAEAVTINKLSPFFVLILSWLFLSEKLKKIQVFAVFLGFAGVAVILRPGSIPLTLPAGLAVLSALFAGSAYTTLRALRKTDRPLLVVFWFSIAITLFFLPSVILGGVMPDLESLVFLVCIGISGTAGQLLMTKAYRCAPGGEVAIYGYLSVLFSMSWQILIFDSVPDATVFIGAGLILLGGWINYRSRG
ncbi:MAG: EamA family transporter [Candidatus Aegiribacteria sp.]|nr:EamA family transporter [Candidatus Aegiribacteria sp.]